MVSAAANHDPKPKQVVNFGQSKVFGPNIIGNREDLNNNRKTLAPSQAAASLAESQEEIKVPELAKVSVSQFVRNVQNKKDLLFALKVKGKFRHSLLSFSLLFFLGQIFLPEDRYCTLEYMKNILAGRKEFLKNDEVRHSMVPRFK